VLWLELGLEK